MHAINSRPASGNLPATLDPMADAIEVAEAPVPGPVDRTIVMVGLMGAGKTSIGKRLAQRLGLTFIDADHEIETAAGCTIEEIFERYGEAAFRDGERKIIQRLLERPPHVLATGGGAFIDPDTRARIKEAGISVWLKADLDVLVRRVSRRNNRPLLKRGEPRDVLARLMEQRYPIYAEADICIDTLDAPAETTVDRVIEAIDRRQREKVASA
jgi:shikimate kinase